MKPKFAFNTRAATQFAIFGLAASAHAASITWNNTATDFNDGNSWTDLLAPGTEDVASFSTAPVTQPELTASTTIQGLSFTNPVTTPATNYTLSSNNTANKLTLTNTTGFIAGNRSATISANIELGAAAASTQSVTHTATTTISGNITEANAGIGLTLNGGFNGILALSGTNTFTGAVTVANGIVRVNDTTKILGDQGSTTSVMGAGTTVFLGSAASTGTLDYRGAGETSNRIFSLAGTTGAGVITANSNPALLKLTSNLAVSGTGNKRFELGGGSTLRNEFAGVIADGVDSVVSLTKNGASGVWVLSNTNTFSGNVSISGGFLTVSNIGNQGSTTSNLGAGTTINISTGTSAGGLVYEGAGETTNRIINLSGTTLGGLIRNNVTGSGSLIFTSDLTATGSGAKVIQFEGSGNGEFHGNIVDSGGGATSVTKRGTGTWFLKGNKTYTGTTQNFVNSVLAVDSLANGGSPSSIGQSSNAAANLVFDSNASPTLRYIGGPTPASTDRLFTIRGAGGVILDASGTGPVSFTNTGSILHAGAINQARSFTLAGTNTGANTFSLLIGNNDAGGGNGVVTFNKNDPGTWVLTNANTYTGFTNINEGTLKLDGGASLANTPRIILNAGAGLDVSTLTTPLGLGEAQSLRSTGGGNTATRTITTASGKNLTLSSGGLLFTSYGGSNGSSATNAPLTVAGATAGELRLNGAPVTVTTTSRLAPGNYLLVAKSGSALVTGTPGTLTVNGSGTNGTASLSVSGNQLVLNVGGSLSGYALWSSTNAPTTDPDEDQDGDGVSNAVEYVLGGTISSNDLAKLPSPSTSGGNLLFTFQRDQDSIDGSTAVVIEVGTNLTAWPDTYTVGADTAGSTTPGVSVAKDTPVTGTDTITISIPQAPDTRKFARLRVTAL